jgi:apolipoprotein N-acyltransferase
VALVQGNIDQGVTADPTSARDRLRIYGELSRRAAPGVRLVVWPEGAVPVYRGEEPAVLASLTTLAATVDRPLLVGTADAEPARAPGERPRSPLEASASPPEARYLNTALLVSGAGVSARYDKMHLVPFGEYVPLKRLLLFVDAVAAELRDMSPGRTTTVFPLAGAPFGTVICYEVIFPSLFRRFVAEGATFMLNLTNDAWVGDSSGPLQHLAMVPLRAVENRVAVGRAANTGVSALVAPSGAIVEALPLGRRGSLHVEVPLTAGGTFYTRHGDWFAHAMSAVSAAALAAIAVPTRVARLRRRGR